MRQLYPRAIWLFFLGNLFKLSLWLVISLIVVAVSSYSAYTIFLLPLYLFFSYIWARLTYSNYKYELTADSFRKEYGIIFKKNVSIPYDKIQNVNIYRGILTRIMGLSDLHIETAGSSAVVYRYSRKDKSEARLPGMSRDEAEKLRDDLMRRAKKRSRG